VAGDPLGGHVVGRADEHADHGERRGVLDRGDAEVGEDNPVAAALDEDVAGFDVAVQDTARVHLAQGCHQTEPDAGHLARAQRAVVRQHAFQ
jgi:hypothetical protein